MEFLRGAAAVNVYLCFAFAYLVSHAFRVINAVIAPALMEDIDLSNADLGLLSAAYFVGFAVLQLPLGIWLDKYGARRTNAALLLFAAVGAAVFANSNSLSGLWIGRTLIGVGVSACLMAAYKAYRQWFAPERMNQLASLMLVAGTFGALSATVPVSWALPLIGWRGVFWVMSAMIVVATAAIFFLLRGVETERAETVSAAGASAAASRGYVEVFRNPYFRRIALLGLINQGSFMAFQTLWAGPWMTTVLNLSEERTAEILFLFNLILLAAYLVFSWWAPRHVSQGDSKGWTAQQVIFAGLAGAILLQLAMLGIAQPWTWVLLIGLGVVLPITTLMQTSVSLAFPISSTGRANSAFNLMVFVGAFFFQWGIGLMIDFFVRYGLSASAAMRVSLGLCVAAQIGTLTLFARNRAQPDL